MSVDSFFYLFFAVPVFFVISGIFFFIQKNKIIDKYQQPDTVKLNNIYGTIVTISKGGLKYSKRFQWCRFEIFINQNSIFLFPRDFYIVPGNCINLRLGSDRRNTRKPEVLREFQIHENHIELIFYPDHLMNTKRTISLNGLNQEQILLFQKALNREA